MADEGTLTERDLLVKVQDHVAEMREEVESVRLSVDQVADWCQKHPALPPGLMPVGGPAGFLKQHWFKLAMLLVVLYSAGAITVNFDLVANILKGMAQQAVPVVPASP